MSVVSSVFSSRSSALGINARLAFAMDNIFAIAFGLALRFVVDLVSHHDMKITGTLVGLWEGVVMLHFLRKMPSSFDPYIAYAARIFIDFLVTENMMRMVLVLVWTGLGMVLADIAPVIWADLGLKRFWRRTRRDLYIISRSIPRVALFPRTRTVRFSSSRAPSVVTSVRSTATPTSLSPTTYSQPPTPRVIPPTPTPPLPRKRIVPGSFPGEISETETEFSVAGRRPPFPPSGSSVARGTSHHIPSGFSGVNLRRSHQAGTEISSAQNDLDDGNLSSSSSSSSSTEIPDPSAANPSEIPDIEEEVHVSTRKPPSRRPDRDLTPTQNPVILPPTPSDSAWDRTFDRARNEQDTREEVQPPAAEVPNIPDFLDGDWENINTGDARPSPVDNKGDLPPTPPAKDVPAAPETSSRELPAPHPNRQSATPSPAGKPVPPRRSTLSAPPSYHEPPSKPLVSEKPPIILTTSTKPAAPTAAKAASVTHAAEPAAAETGNLLDLSDAIDAPPPFEDIYGDYKHDSQAAASVHAPHPEPVPDANATTNANANANATTDTNNDLNVNTNDADLYDTNVNTNANVDATTNNDNKGAEETVPQGQEQTTEPPVIPEKQPEEPALQTAPADAGAGGAGDAEEVSSQISEPLGSDGDSALGESLSDTLRVMLNIRKESIVLEKQIMEINRQARAAEADEAPDLAAEKKAEVRKLEKQLAKLSRRGDRRAKLDVDNPVASDKVDLSEFATPVFPPELEGALIRALRPGQNIPKLIVTLGLKVKGTNQKKRLALIMNQHSLEYKENGRIVTIDLPH